MKTIKTKILAFLAGRKILILSLVFLLVSSPLLYSSLRTNKKAEAAWWDETWLYRKAVNITNSSGENLTDFQVAITLDTASLISAGKMQSDCDDIRITDINGKLLPHWIEENNPGCNASNTKIWTKVPSIPDSGATVYIYYGNQSAQNYENGDEVFEFFDDFDTNTLSDYDIGLKTVPGWNDPIDPVYDSVNKRVSINTGDNLESSLSPKGINSADIYAEAVFHIDGGYPLGASGRISVRWQDANNHYYGEKSGSEYSPSGEGGFYCSYTSPRLRKTISGSDTQIAAPATNSYISLGTHQKLAVGITGNTIKFFVDDVEQLSTTDSDITSSGRIIFSGLQYNGWIDEIRIRKYASTEPSASLGSEEYSPGPVAYWKFDEGYGTTVHDSTQNGNNGTISGAIWQTEDMCVAGRCLYFDGNDYIIINSDSLPSSGTIEMWIKPNFDSTNITWQYLFHTSNNYFALMWSRFSDARWTWYVTGDDTANTVSFSRNTWHYISATWGANEKKFYWDGNLINTWPAETVSSGAKWYIGRHYAGGHYFNGFIDEVKIYPYARSDEEIKADYLAGLHGMGTVKGAAAVLGTTKEKAGGVNLSDGLVGYWKMDESSWNGTSGEVIDSSGNGNNGTSYGGATTGAGKFGNGGSFDGNDDYVDVGDQSSLEGMTYLTVTAWVKPIQNSGEDNIIIVDKRYSSAYRFHIYDTNQTDNVGTLVAWINNEPLSSGVSIDMTGNVWQHVTLTYDGTNGKVDFYLDGQLLRTLFINPNPIGTNTTSFKIGKSTSTQYFKGTLDEVRIYNRALSPREVRALYEWAPGPVNYYNLDERTGTVTTDYGTGGKNGSFISTPVWTIGKYGSGLNFDGNDDGVTVSNIGVGANSAFTVMGWINWDGVTYPAGNPKDFMGFATDGTGYSSCDWTVLIRRTSPTSNSIHFYINSGHRVSTSVTLGTNTWHHLAVTYDNSNAKIYFDGILKNSASYSTPVSNNYSSGSFGKAGGYYFGGKIDDFKIYNYARTQKQIIEDMNAGHPAGGSPVGSQLAYWKFDEGYGSTAHDESPQGKDGNIHGTTWTNNGKFGKALYFNGSATDYVSYTIPEIINSDSNSFSISAWLKAESGTQSEAFIAGKVGYHSGLLVPNGTSIRFQLWPDGYGTRYYASYSISQNVWYHAVAVFNRDTNLMSLYVNGDLKDTETFSGNIANYNSNFYTGGYGNSNWNFKGYIDELKIYNFALTEDEVKAEYNRGAAIVLGSLSDTSGLSGGTIASNSASAEYCIPGDTSYCAPPVAEWRFDEGVGSTVYDTSGNGNNGTLTNGPTWATGKIGKALSFDGSDDYVDCGSGSLLNVIDGSDDYVDCGSGSLLNVTGALTLEAWVKPNSFSNYDTIVGNEADSGRSGYRLFSYNGLALRLNESTTVSGSDLTDGVWQHVAAVFIPSTSITLYINGQQNTRSTTNIPASITSSPSNVWIGGRVGDIGLPSRNFNGLIDQVRIYDYARTPAQIAWDYNRGKPWIHLKLDECQGTTAYDSSGNGYNANIIIGTTSPQTSAGTCTDGQSTSAWYNGANGKYNASLRLDRADDYIDFANNNPNFAGMPAFTLSAWIYPESSSANRVIFGKFNEADQGYGSSVFKIWLGTDDKIHYKLSTQGDWPNQIDSPSALTENQWHLVTATWTGSDIYLYIDAVPVANMSVGGTLTNPETLTIGKESYTNSNYFLGKIDDVRIYNYALTEAQVKQLYNQGAAIRFGPETGSP